MVTTSSDTVDFARPRSIAEILDRGTGAMARAGSTNAIVWPQAAQFFIAIGYGVTVPVAVGAIIFSIADASRTGAPVGAACAAGFRFGARIFKLYAFTILAQTFALARTERRRALLVAICAFVPSVLEFAVSPILTTAHAATFVRIAVDSIFGAIAIVFSIATAVAYDEDLRLRYEGGGLLRAAS